MAGGITNREIITAQRRGFLPKGPKANMSMGDIHAGVSKMYADIRMKAEKKFQKEKSHLLKKKEDYTKVKAAGSKAVEQEMRRIQRGK